MTNPFHILRSKNGVHFLSEPDRRFENIYLDAREREGWLYKDELLKQLPAVSDNDPHKTLWQMRAQSLARFSRYVAAQAQGTINILDIGCGNGWFSHALAKAVPAARIFGLDINLRELEQAARVFGDQRPVWLYGDLFAVPLPDRFFNLVLFNGSFQYFPDTRALITRLLPALAEGGEIHILDSPFYPPHEKAGAVVRSEAYYTKLGVAAMAGYYHAHTLEDLATYHPTLLHDPSAWSNRLRRITGAIVNPLPWLRLRP